MDFETLDKIADSYIPFLAIAFLVGVGGRAILHPGERQFLGQVFIFFIGLLCVAYGTMFVDNAVHVWSSFNLDYSTHTAVSLALVLSLCALARKFWKTFIVSLLIYVLLMLYQKYHTFADIASTAPVIVFSAFLLAKLLFLQAKDNKSCHSQP